MWLQRFILTVYSPIFLYFILSYSCDNIVCYLNTNHYLIDKDKYNFPSENKCFLGNYIKINIELSVKCNKNNIKKEQCNHRDNNKEINKNNNNIN